MKTFLKIVSSLLLLFNGIGAIFGGWNLMNHPDGSSMQMSLDYLKHSPFSDYLISGVILFAANGLFSFFVLTSIALRLKDFPSFIIAQGAILAGWIMIQVIMIQTIINLHYILGSVGLLLIVCGWALTRIAVQERKRIS
jgi:DMSO reductase anchor subunit